MPEFEAESHCFGVRLLNPYHGVAQIIEINRARAVSTDGVKWLLQMRSAIYKSPWSSLAIPVSDKDYFVYGVWSQQEGLARTPIHPSLYQDHVEDIAQHLIQAISHSLGRIPFVLLDTVELWLCDSAAQHPVALLASNLPGLTIPVQHSLLWQPSQTSDTPFTSEACTEISTRDTIKCSPEDLLMDLIKQRCNPPFYAVWIERDAQGNGTVLQDHKGRVPRQRQQLAADLFPPCLLAEDWESAQASQLVRDYLNWQAPILLMLPLPPARRHELERQAQHRPLSVHDFHRLYPEVTDKMLLNKILVEAVMRMSSR